MFRYFYNKEILILPSEKKDSRFIMHRDEYNRKVLILHDGPDYR